jgi:hypothetical protein
MRVRLSITRPEQFSRSVSSFARWDGSRVSRPECFVHNGYEGKLMTLTVDLSDDQAAAVAARARAQGMSAEQYVRQLLEHDLVPEWLRRSWQNSQRDGVDQLSMEEIDAEIAAARAARHESR